MGQESRRQLYQRLGFVALVRYEVPIPKIHDLEDLEDLIARAEPDVRLIDAYLDMLNPNGADIHHPGSAATDNDAKEAVKAMKAIRKFLRAKLGLKVR
jgi:HEPN domain-containing protein